jgi:hypothetical protein
VPAIRANRAKEKLQEGKVAVTISGNLSSEIIDFMGRWGLMRSGLNASTALLPGSS